VPSDTLAANAVPFGRPLCRARLATNPGQTRLFVRALVLLGLSRKADVKAAGRMVYATDARTVPSM
jgi:uncharacterized protein with von Willebrand factor type A (vWA) domain